jgi:hypothetical protein
MGDIYRWSEWAPPLIWGCNSPNPGRLAVHVAGRPPNSSFTDFGYRIPRAPTLLDTLATQKLTWRQHQACRPSRWGLSAPLWLGWAWALCHIIPRVILSVTMPYFGHIEDMHGFCFIWCFFIIRCSWNGRSTKLTELVRNKHLSSISCMKCRYVGGKYMHFMTANTRLLAKCPVQKPFVLQSHSKTMEFNTYDHIASQMVTSSSSLDNYCCRRMSHPGSRKQNRSLHTCA